MDNFGYLFRTKDAYVIFRNTVLYNVAFIVLGTVLAIAVAILLSQVRGKMMRVYQTTILIPYLIAITVVAYLGLRLPVHRYRLYQQFHFGSLGN